MTTSRARAATHGFYWEQTLESNNCTPDGAAGHTICATKTRRSKHGNRRSPGASHRALQGQKLYNVQSAPFGLSMATSPTSQHSRPALPLPSSKRETTGEIAEGSTAQQKRTTEARAPLERPCMKPPTARTRIQNVTINNDHEERRRDNYNYAR